MPTASMSSLDATSILKAWQRRHSSQASLCDMTISRDPFEVLLERLSDAARRYMYPVAGVWMPLTHLDNEIAEECIADRTPTPHLAMRASQVALAQLKDDVPPRTKSHCGIVVAAEEDFGKDQLLACVLLAVPVKD